MTLLEKIFAFVVAGLISTVVCIVGYGISPLEAFLGCSCIVLITVAGILLAKVLPGHLPMVFWVSILAIFVSTPISPIAGFVTHYVGKVDFLALCTVVLSYAGLTIGKDIGMFRKMSWRIIVVALAVYTGTFIFATAIAEFMLHIEGVI